MTTPAPDASATPATRKRGLTTLEVLDREFISPAMVRVTLGGPGFADFNNNDFTDRYVKLQFFPEPADAEGAVELNEVKERLPQERWPVSRTYTVRSVDQQRQQLCIDFVVHGDSGIAGPWAASAEPGQKLVFAGPGGGYSPSSESDWHLLVGDESALPALAAALEALPTQAIGLAFIEVDSAQDELELVTPEGMKVTWLHRNGGSVGDSTLLADALASSEWPEGTPQGFIHGERGYVKSLRDVLLKQRGLSRQDLSISGYWAFGRAEDTFQAEKRLEIGKI